MADSTFERGNSNDKQLHNVRKAATRSNKTTTGPALEDNRPSPYNSPLQRNSNIKPNSALQRNNTGLPDNLKSGMENLSGTSLDHVRVHYNSSKPAAVQAHAFAQGSDIHVAPGQERHLPHELGHVVQQMQGRVKPTINVGGTPINDNPGLEHEATLMGERAMQRASKTGLMPYLTAPAAKSDTLNKDGTAQFRSMDGMGVEGVDYAVMSQKSYGQWQKTLQAKSMSGVCHYGDQVVVTQFRRPQDIRQYALSAKIKGGLLIAEGILALAAGTAVVVISHGLGLIPGIAAIAVGVAKIVRGIVTYRSGEQPTEGQKKVMDALRGFEATAAIVGAAASINIAGLIFGVAKALRSLLTALDNFLIDKEAHPTIHKGMIRLAGALHIVEVGAGIALGITGSVDAAGSVTGTAAKATGAAANFLVAGSKAVRAGDQNINAWKKKAPEQAPLLPE